MARNTLKSASLRTAGPPPPAGGSIAAAPTHLHQVVDHHVAERADRVVEVAAVVDPEVLRHRDLDRRHVVAVPDRLERRVREPQVEDLRQAHLAEEVVDPVQLGLVDVRMDLLVELARGREVVPERLLDDDARVLGQPGAGEARDDGAEQERRDLEVEDRLPDGADRGGEPLERVGIAEIALDVAQSRREALEGRVVDRPAGGDRGVGVLAQVVEAPVVDRYADDRAVEHAAPLQPVERPERHHLRKVAGDAERDEHVGGPRLIDSGRGRPRVGCRGHAGTEPQPALAAITPWG